MTTVAEIAARIPAARWIGDGGAEVRGASCDSRQVEPGMLFAALPGEKTDGRLFVDQALERGAAAVLSGEALERRAPVIVVSDARAALGEAAAACYGDPTRELGLVGVTGTNGKTTVVYLVEAALRSIGARPGVMGTVEHRFEQKSWSARHTTPEATLIQAVAREMADAGATHLVMEVSSHGLALDRHRGCRFNVVAFTNLTQDHLDFHADMEDYAAAKLRLFGEAIADRPRARIAVNVDDPFSARILETAEHPVLTVSCERNSAADVRPCDEPRIGIEGVEAEVITPGGEVRLSSPLLGEHNLSNLLVALGICLQLGLDPERAAKGLGAVAAIPGRLERVAGGDDFAVLVDYAHTPDALENALDALRPLTAGRLICVFGCGGDRDNDKRPLMGRAVAARAEIAIVTSDNPRREDPDRIIEMILPGVEEGGLARIALADLTNAERGFAVEPDRSAAIRLAVSATAPGDTVLIAGKGHEDYQLLGAETIHFDDRKHAAAALAEPKDAEARR
jgi:UDP-N-acetylmuramoyl-L-alanyl-D-glutamate--2,6-diaminopimelate ligase